MKNLLLAVTVALMGLCTVPLRAQVPVFEAPDALADALALTGGKTVVFQPVQIKRNQQLIVTHTAFRKSIAPRGSKQASALAIYATTGDKAGHLLYQDVFIPSEAQAAGPHVKVFDGYLHAAEQQGVIAILIGLLLPAVQGTPKVVPLPRVDAITAELHDNAILIGLLLPAVQKVREAAAR
ncbi:MAG: hypothetical protein V4710_13775 [Verrucomicrobiota bacterium]